MAEPTRLELATQCDSFRTGGGFGSLNHHLRQCAAALRSADEEIARLKVLKQHMAAQIRDQQAALARHLPANPSTKAKEENEKAG